MRRKLIISKFGIFSLSNKPGVMLTPWYQIRVNVLLRPDYSSKHRSTLIFSKVSQYQYLLSKTTFAPILFFDFYQMKNVQCGSVANSYVLSKDVFDDHHILWCVFLSCCENALATDLIFFGLL